MTKLLLLLALLLLALFPLSCLAQTAQPNLNNQSSTTTQTGNVTVNLGTGTAVLSDNGGHIITVTVTVDPQVVAMKKALASCQAGILAARGPIANLMARPPAVGQDIWKIPLTAASVLLEDAETQIELLSTLLPTFPPIP